VGTLISFPRPPSLFLVCSFKFSNERTKQVAAASAGGGNLPAVQRVCAGTAYKDAFGRPRYYQEVNYGDPRQNDMRKLGGLRWDSPSSKTSTSTRPTTVGDMRPCKSSPSLLSMSATSPKAAHNSTFGGKTFKPESPTNAMQFTLSEIVPKEGASHSPHDFQTHAYIPSLSIFHHACPSP
jgi:hypothetical protein